MGTKLDCTLDVLGHELHTIMINKHYTNFHTLGKIKLKNRTPLTSPDTIHMFDSVKVAMGKSGFKKTKDMHCVQRTQLFST
jgi:hypothetical protein